MEPLISVIIPTFNRAHFLEKSAQSVLSQSYKNIELVIIDDGSTDNTKELVKKLKGNIIYANQANKGPASARNLGITKSKSDLIAFLDSDDYWHKDKLKIQVKEMLKNPEFFISHTQEIWYKNKKLLNQKKKHKKHHGYIFNRCLNLCVVSMSTVIIKKEIFNNLGVFDEAMPCCEDYDFWLRVSSKYRFMLLDKALTFKEGGRLDQVSCAHKTGIDKYRIHSLVKLLKNKNFLSWQQRLAAIDELKKKCFIYGNGCIKHNKINEGRLYLSMPDNYS